MSTTKHLNFAPFIIAIAMLVPGVPLLGSETDDRIESSFRTTYVYKTYLSEDSVTTEAKDGVVTLTGTVADASHKSLAEETAASLPGVTRVDNKLLTKTDAAADRSDMWIGRKIKLTLMFHRHVSSGTTVEVKDGIVTLKGESASLAEKELTGEYAKDIDGVKGIKNEMTVVPALTKAELSKSEQIDDASITAQIKTALAAHSSTSNVNTKVATRSGDVILTGIAKNEAEKTLISKLVNDIQGVSSVKNQMTIGDTK